MFKIRFIRGETCLGLFVVKLGSSRCYCTGKRFSASFQRVMLIFISFSSKERFRLSSAKLRCFQHYVPEKRLFLRKLCFWPFFLSKTCFGVLAMRSDASRHLLQKNSDFVFRFGIPFFESHGSENTFFVCWQQNRTALSFISQKKHFCFFVAKTRWIQLYSTKNMFWFVFCNTALFSVLLH